MTTNKQVEAELFRHLLDNSATPLIGSVIGALLVTLAYHGSTYQTHIQVWLLILLATTAIRILLTRQCMARFKAQGYVPREALRYALTTGLSGVVWGVGSLFVLDASPMAMVVSITMVQAMVLGGALTLSAYPPSFYAFSLPAIFPMILALCLQGGSTNIILATQSVVFLTLVFSISKRFNRALQHVWQLTFEKEHLLQALTEANAHQKALANTDGLTGIANRRRFDHVLSRELSRMSRAPSPLSLLMLDVDHFKSYNDNYGHVAGDECLKQIARILHEQFGRASDTPARYGGEEFTVIMPHTDEHGALRQAQGIRRAMEQLQIAHAHSPVAQHITLSMGIVSLHTPDVREAKDLIAMADQCLYQAKSAGRNRIVATVWPPATAPHARPHQTTDSSHCAAAS